MRQIVAIITLLVGTAAQTASAGPTCALLDPEKTPRAALLEAKLLTEPGATWVERANIDTVLKEQKLQALFSAQGVGERVKLGKLLKADLLIMVRPVKGAEQPAIEVIISETASGLRLSVRAVPVTKDADADVVALLAATRDGIKRYGEKITDVVAVPPFLNNDLGYEFDHLKGAFAKLAESVALDRKGMVVVELAEAEALAKELRLAAPGTVLRGRAPPVFLIGEYRNEEKGKDRTVSIKLRAERGGKPVGKPAADVLKPERAPEAIRTWAATVLEAAGAIDPPLPNARAEAKRLGELARTHRRLGNWSEAIALIEASLLLDPKQPELNADAVEILPRWIADLLRVISGYPTAAHQGLYRRAAELHRRGLEHLEVLVTSGVKLTRHAPRPGPGLPPRFFASPATNVYDKFTAPAVLEVVRPLRAEEAAVYTRLILHVAKQGNLWEEVYYTFRAGYYFEPSERYARLEKTLLGLRDLPGWRERLRAHLLHYSNLPTGPPASLGFAEHRRFLDRLEAAGDADVKAVVAEARKAAVEREQGGKDIAARLEKERVASAAFAAAKKLNPKLGTPLSSSDPDRLDTALKGSPFQHIRLTGQPIEPDPGLSKDHTFPRLGQIRGILPAGPGVDVLWADGEFSDGTLYVMKEKGKLKRIYRIGGLRAKFTSVVFDGRYVWAAGDRPGAQPVMLVLDPATERVTAITEKNGLPVGRKGVAPRPDERVPGNRIAALDPGRVCVAGGFGQAWVAVATFDPANGVTVKVIHEAREAEGENSDDWKKTTVAFQPWHVFTLRGEPGADGKTPTRVLVSRMGGSQAMMQHPLLVDPDRPVAEVMRKVAPGLKALPGLNHYSVCGTGRSVYVAWGMGQQVSPPKEPRLYRIDFPGTLRDLGPLPAARNNPALHFDGQNLHVVRVASELLPWQEFVPVKERWWPAGDPNDWWVADPDRKGLKKAATDFPRVFAVGTSSHYGMVVLLAFRLETALCSVELHPPPGPGGPPLPEGTVDSR